MDIVGGVVKETKDHPYTMLALVGLLFAVPYLYVNDARAADVQQLTAQIQALQYTVTRTSLENQLRTINTELFNLQQQVSELEKKNKRADQYVYDRINTLLSDQGTTIRALNNLK